MADHGPRCKRRKQANPKRSSVTNFNNGLEASSDSDDEDKLHIVEEESLQEPAGVAGGAATKARTSRRTAAKTHSHAQNGSCNGVKEENVSEGEEEEEEQEEEEEEEAGKDALVEEILQQGDTAIIYPEAPEDEQSPVETGGADENGTPDSFSQLHTCPYCSRGYKRNASLKEHIRYRHETSDSNYSCSHCSYTFTYRSQLERHMSHHRGGGGTREQRSQTAAGVGSGGTRKFKCNECSKAFKYKHHLKEHLRIHSGEKPYECSNCKKRFSHSGSYSSHISSKKCVAAARPNGVARTAAKASAQAPSTAQAAPLVIAPARVVLKEKLESKPLQEQLPVTQIKSEPVEIACKPVMMAAPATSTNGVVNGGATQPAATTTTLPPGVAMVVPTVGLMSPISINLNDLQNVLKVAMDGNVLRQVLGSANGAVAQGKQGIVVQQPQQQIISLPAFVDHDGTTKIIINYSISPAPGTTATTQPTPLVVKNNPVAPPTVTSAAAAPSPTNTDKHVANLSLVKEEPEESVPVTDEHHVPRQTQTDTPDTAPVPKVNTTSTCLLCEECPDHLEALHLLQHRKAANGEAVDSAALDPSFAALLSEAGVTLEEPPVEDIVSLLKNYFASNANPGQKELTELSESVCIPVDVVRKWFVKMNSGKRAGKGTTDILNENGQKEDTHRETSTKVSSGSRSSSPLDSTSLKVNNGEVVVVKSEPEDPEALNSQAEPLDLSLPKHIAEALKAKMTVLNAKQEEQPLNLTQLQEDAAQQPQPLGTQTIYVTTQQSGNPVNIVTAGQMPTIVAVTGAGGQGCLGAINSTTKRTILIPQLTYTYATAAGNTSAAANTVVLNGHKEEKSAESGADGAPAGDEQNDSDSAGLAKRRRVDNGFYPCDLCSKVFQKGSSLLRHKYEHTGKRPHECSICNKAFKHKHHLIEHSRLHSGEKPYQCDKCGKRFSHSGSYSQHMNHRYSYCKKDGSGSGAGSGSESGPRKTRQQQSDSRTTTPPSQMDSDERESEEEEEEDDDDEAMCMDDIRVVQVDDGECEIYEGNFDDEEEDDDEEGEETGSDKMEKEELGFDVVEFDDHSGDEEESDKEEGEEEEGKQEAAAAAAAEDDDCEAKTDRTVDEEKKETESD